MDMRARPPKNKRKFGRRSRSRSRSSIWMLSATPGLMAWATLVRDASWAGRTLLIINTTKEEITTGMTVAKVTWRVKGVVMPSWAICRSIRGKTTKWVINFGDPIDLPACLGADEQELLVSRLTEELRTQIQELVDRGLEQRVSVWS